MGKNNSDIIIIIVFYNPTEEQIRNADSIAQNYNVIAVDNSSAAITSSYHFEYISLLENKGIAAAQNIGIEYARNNNFKFILFLDQDSKISSNYVYDLCIEYKHLKQSDSTLALLGPSLTDIASGKKYKGFKDEITPYKVSAIISSGSFAETDIFYKVGKLDESLFIDYVDFEWCWRAISLGCTIYITPNVQMFHSIGNDYNNYLGFIVNISSPQRYYYQYRNTFFLLSKNYVPRKWKIKSLTRKIIDLIVLPFCVKKKRQTLRYIFKGIVDGFKTTRHEKI